MPGSSLTRARAKKDMFGEEEHVPKWACQLLSEIQSVEETCNVRFDNLDKAIVQLKKDSNGAFPLHGLARPRSVWLGLVRTGSLYGAFPLQFRNWGSIYSNAV